ncbi:unnamed protein product [Danaus chrysippus]|uniref:(African queen) hypothetical protein n=1 Tax=Danaus chrysippus TaxID=151541 RepID=A0A8J2QYM2_9NEOP|nr:unnamed protein product [Danaus chrysippus]
MPGSVLLPATRRGRYLANIIRRQAVMNAEAKKKVDVLSEELLPYIIAEQERRTTLYKRIMTAIQNGEKGVTIAEIRNKPPLIIRKGWFITTRTIRQVTERHSLLYRCPSNRAPKEPDGSGSLMCEDDLEPTQVMYDSCLSAEDKELYVAENKYFFCNRHKVEGPDLPRNGSTVIGCAPIERTSLNYTTSKCALEDTDDVVVHYRYYPDRSYKFVSELDPDREVCDHWNPCQIGYIYSLPSPDLALPANELWQDSSEEFVSPSAKNYTSSTKRLPVPEGYTFVYITGYSVNDKEVDKNGKLVYKLRKLDRSLYTTKLSNHDRFISVTLDFPHWSSSYYQQYQVAFAKTPDTKPYKYVPFLRLSEGTANIISRRLELLQGQQANSTLIPYRCERCRLINLMVRAGDGNAHQFLQILLESMRPQDFGDYFAVLQNADGLEERVKVLSVLFIKTDRLTTSLKVGGHFDHAMTYKCEECQLTDILCNGHSALSTGRVTVIPVSKLINFNFPRFEDTNACVYIGFFKQDGKVYQKILGVIEKVTIPYKKVVDAPKEGEQFQYQVPYNCDNCLVDRVYCDGIQLELMSSTRRSGVGSIGYYEVSPTDITIRITEFSPTFEGVYQAVFVLGGDTVSKTILEIRDPEAHEGEDSDQEETTEPLEATTEVATAAASEEATTEAATTAAPK